MAVIINAKGTSTDQFKVGKYADGGTLQGYIDLNTTATIADSVGRVKWNEVDGTIEVGLKGGNVTLQVGQESVVRALNKTG